jgi:hypothetical protein
MEIGYQVGNTYKGRMVSAVNYSALLKSSCAKFRSLHSDQQRNATKFDMAQRA